MAELATAINGGHKAGVILLRGSRRITPAVELTRMGWVAPRDHHRMNGPLDRLPTAEFQAEHQRQRDGLVATG